ncbi:MAG: YaiI/YqxD family protein [Leptolyngbya sp. SIO4C5]|nr:YaiI/YqxD family protein [Leptolyngbya sp. SIO4C5]
MQIWVDADACPNVIKEILFRAAKRVQVLTTLVANQPLQVPASAYIETVLVGAGFNRADSYIVAQLEPGDLVITADIPLAAEAIAQGAYALSPRGVLFDQGNIRERLSLRNFMEDLRSSGVETGGPPAFSQRDREAFANQLDRFLVKHRPPSEPGG